MSEPRCLHSLVPQGRGCGESLPIECVRGVVGSGGSGHGHGGPGGGQGALGVRVVAAAESQRVVRAAQGQRARAARGARRGDVHVARHGRGRCAGQRRGAGVAGEEFIGAREGSMGPQVAKQLLRGGKALVAGSVGRHPVADVWLGVVGEHEAVGVQRVAG